MTARRAAGLLLAAVWLGALPASALTGTIVDEAKKPLDGVKVCYMLGGAEGICAATDARGFFELPASTVDRIRITKDGYLPQVVGAVPQGTPVVLVQSAGIWVKLIDQAGKPLDKGEVFLIVPSGARKGPFPVNANGVRVRSLERGEYRVVAKVEGLAQQRSVAVVLVPGEEGEVTVKLAPVR